MHHCHTYPLSKTTSVNRAEFESQNVHNTYEAVRKSSPELSCGFLLFIMLHKVKVIMINISNYNDHSNESFSAVLCNVFSVFQSVD